MKSAFRKSQGKGSKGKAQAGEATSITEAVCPASRKIILFALIKFFEIDASVLGFLTTLFGGG